MKKSLIVAALAAALSVSGAVEQSFVACAGYFPEHGVKIPVRAGPSAAAAGGLTKEQFDAVLDRLEEVYAPIVAAQGGVLEIRRLWDDGSVNASAAREGDRWIVNMFGGMARHPAITPDGFSLVACHEMGHHLGGFPARGLSVEGQADYFANMKCHRRVWLEKDNLRAGAGHGVDAFAAKRCAAVFETAAARALCARSAMAGLVMAKVAQALSGQPSLARFDSPDPSRVAKTSPAHPAPQCRLDTHFQSALCVKPATEDFSWSDSHPGACTRDEGFTAGVRPLCWYKPPVPAAPGRPKIAAAASAALDAARSMEAALNGRGI